MFTVNEDYRVIGGLRGNLSLVFSDIFCVRGEIIDDFTLERKETLYITFDPVVESSMIPSNVTVIEQGVGGEVTIVIEDNESNILYLIEMFCIEFMGGFITRVFGELCVTITSLSI